MGLSQAEQLYGASLASAEVLLTLLEINTDTQTHTQSGVCRVASTTKKQMTDYVTIVLVLTICGPTFQLHGCYTCNIYRVVFYKKSYTFCT